MACYKPNTVKYVGRVPCGQCIGCRLDKSYEWAHRCMDERTLYPDGTCHFITLTYANEHLPNPPSLSVRAHQLFMKKLRKAFPCSSIRFFLGAEYGDQRRTFRPHYHYVIFGLPLDDLKFYKRSPNGVLYNSAKLSKCWPYGFAVVAELNFKTAAYVARYSLKKVTGKKAADYYGCLKPEFSLSSKKPAIGLRWLQKEMNTWRLLHDGHKVAESGRITGIPRYYKKKLKEWFPHNYEEMLQKQLDAMRSDAKMYETRQDRLAVKEKVKEAQMRFTSRSNDND